jgi:hypothetical protein
VAGRAVGCAEEWWGFYFLKVSLREVLVCIVSRFPKSLVSVKQVAIRVERNDESFS